MSFAQALIASDLSVSWEATHEATRGQRPALASLLYTDTPHRRALRALLDGASLAGCRVKLAFVKADWSMRYMLAEPCAGTDATARYVTVVDVELSAESGRTIYRRVCLDTIAGLSIEWKPA